MHIQYHVLPLEATDTQIKCSEVSVVVVPTVCVQILRCEIYIRGSIYLSMVNAEDGSSITWNINQELDKSLRTFPAPTGNVGQTCQGYGAIKATFVPINVWI